MSKASKIGLFMGVPLMIYMSAVHTMLMPTIISPVVSDFGCLEQYSWTASSFLLASMGTMPIYGRLCDLWGPRRVSLLACALFALGSLFCGLSQGVWSLVMARGLQGTGSSAMLTASYVIYGRTFSVERRALALGALGAACATAMFTGPSVAAYIAKNLHWSWTFFFCIPPTALSAVLVSAVQDRNEVTADKGGIDLVGALLFVSGAICVTLSLMGLTKLEPGLFPLVPATAGVLLLWILTRRCRVSAVPYLALHLLNNRSLAIASVIGFLTGAVMFAFPYLSSLLVQGGMGLSAEVASRISIPVSIGWVLGSLLSGTVMNQIGLRGVLVLGVACFLLAFQGMLVPGASTSQGVLMLLSLFTGLGLGLCLNATVCAAQTEAPARELGAATSFMNLVRILGGAWGGALCSALQLGMFQSQLRGLSGGDLLQEAPQRILSSSELLDIPAPVVALARQFFVDAIWWVSLGACLIVAVCLVLALRIPVKGRPVSCATSET